MARNATQPGIQKDYRVIPEGNKGVVMIQSESP